MRGLTTGFSLSPDQARMLDELKSYLADTFPLEREGVVGTSPEWCSDSEFEWVRQFNAQLARDGWLVPQWPEEYGGRGLTAVESMLIREELAYRRIPTANSNGVDMLAPILLRFGTQAQKDEHLVKIATMERLWCQGYSEPDAGSDLAALRTTARREGDVYVVNGSKIWTGHAMRAHWMVLLARTDLDSKGTRGLSLLLVDLENTPGVTVHPIRSMTGAATFCQEYFEDSLVPVENLVGPEHGGWGASRVLLEHERAPLGQAAKYRRQLDDLLDVAAGRPISPRTSSKLGRLVERVESLRAMTYALAQSFSVDGEPQFPPHMPSVIKVFGSELAVELAGVSCEVLGLDIAAFQPPDRGWDFWQEFLHSLIYRIGGGTNEIQREIIALRKFGLART
jgi:alkylation response protein AidB-like acyl-CoA dehydrogenase